jgi:putative addiction module killer protein
MDIKGREIRLLVDDHDHVPFLDWFKGLRDTRAMVAINSRMFRAADGNFGDHKFFRGIGEMRVDVGPGYRVYFALHEDVVIVLIGGGDKRTQDKDIEAAVALWEKYKNAPDRFRRRDG